MIETSSQMISDRWLYLKIYTGNHTADRILVETLQDFSQQLISRNIAANWFFIRYADPDFHLRYRIQLKEPSYLPESLSLLRFEMQKYLDDDLVWRIELSTYEPELERYGKQSMQDVESIFCADSEAFVGYIQHPLAKADTDSRWLFAICAVNDFLNNFNVSLEDRKGILLHLNRSFGNEFNKNKYLARQISNNYRIHRVRITQCLEGVHRSDNDKFLSKILTDRKMKTLSEVAYILSLYDRAEMEVPRDEFLSSLMHMTINRIFQNRNRAHEMVLYDFLFRYYKSAIYREKTIFY